MTLKEKINGNASWLRFGFIVIFLIGYVGTNSLSEGKQTKAIEILEKDVVLIGKQETKIATLEANSVNIIKTTDRIEDKVDKFIEQQSQINQAILEHIIRDSN